ncbi:MAG: class I SAM-dependent methyltransferase, partial [Vicinamibacteria bacterium]
PCPVCGVDAHRLLGLRGGAHHRYRLGIESRIVRCDRCGLLFPDPFPFPLDPQRLYGEPDDYFGTTDTGRKIEAYRGLMRQLAQRLGRTRFSVLDVGCGRGELLAAARLEGVEAVGLEPSEAMAARARESLGVDVQCRTIEELVTSTDTVFDAVTLCGVLEHVHDPDSLVASVRKLTRPDAVVYIDVPREPNLLTIVGNAWNAVKGDPAVYNLQPTWPPYHVFGFNPRAIEHLLSKHDFRIESLHVQADTHVPSRDDWKDRIRALVASQIHRLGNQTHLSANMYVWARRLHAA